MLLLKWLKKHNSLCGRIIIRLSYIEADVVITISHQDFAAKQFNRIIKCYSTLVNWLYVLLLFNIPSSFTKFED
jgi:hypothetical protein